MPPVTPFDRPRLATMVSWPRVLSTLTGCVLVSLLVLPGWSGSYAHLISRLLLAGLVVLLGFGLFERWPAGLPSWLPRWMLQVVGVAVAVPLGVAIAYTVMTIGLEPPWFWHWEYRHGFRKVVSLGLVVATWMAISALLRRVSGEAQRQALRFELERSELERQALDARLRVLQRQIEPHFLFNTLANVRELVDSGSPQASAVLASLIAYLRAAIPRLHESAATLGQELELVRAYLEVMHMRMPDRLQYALLVDDEGIALDCPPMTLLTLVENAVRHGIDPSEDGGRIEVRVRVRDGRCRAEVVDTGVGLPSARDHAGTGLSNLRERLQLAFAGDAQVRLEPFAPRGAWAEMEFPARRSAV
jgi:signal transduction histidine kinase